MRLQSVQLFPKVLSDRFQERCPSSTREELYLFFSYKEASCAIRDAILAWAAVSVGPNYRALLDKIVEMENKGLVVDHITTAWEMKVEDSALFRDLGGGLSREAVLKRHEERTPDWMKAWEKVARMGAIPPRLTPEEIAHIERIAEEVLALMNAPETSEPSVFNAPSETS